LWAKPVVIHLEVYKSGKKESRIPPSGLGRRLSGFLSCCALCLRSHNFESDVGEIQFGKIRNPIEPLSRPTEFLIRVKSEEAISKEKKRWPRGL
jgi:hypothetical protein